MPVRLLASAAVVLLLAGCASSGQFTVADGAGTRAGAAVPSGPGADPSTQATFATNPECPFTPSQGAMSSYEPNAPAQASTGTGLTITGTVITDADCRPLAGATVEIWHEDPRSGNYQYTPRTRTTLTTGPDGTYTYTTDPLAGPQGGEPHVHMRVSAPDVATVWLSLPATGGRVPGDVTVHDLRTGTEPSTGADTAESAV